GRSARGGRGCLARPPCRIIEAAGAARSLIMTDLASDSLLPFDAPVELGALLRPDERKLLLSSGQDLRCPFALLDRDGAAVLGEAPPAPVRCATPEAEPQRVLVDAKNGAGPAAYLCGSLFHDGDRLALMVAG